MRYFIALLFGVLLHQMVFAQCTTPVITASGPTTFCAGGSVTLSVNDTWLQKADYNGAVKTGAVGFSIGTKGYIGTGYSVSGNTAGPTKDFWQYDPATDVWTQKADFAGYYRTGAIGFSIGNLGYIGLGDNGIYYKDFYEYNPATNVWTRKADFGGTGRTNAVGFSIGGKGYIGTGNDGNAEKDFWEYDPTTNGWTRKADFAGAARYAAVGFSMSGKGYIGTGNDGSPEKDFWEYDPTTNGWTRKADFAGAARYAAVAFSIDNRGYIGTGKLNSVTYPAIGAKDLWEYNPLTNNWLKKADFGGLERISSTGFSIGSKGYIGTGATQNYSYTKDLWVYEPVSYSWSPGGQTTSSITATTSGNYTVTTTNALGCSATSATTSVTIKPAPQITTQPQSVTTCKGSPVSLSVTATGTNLVYKWYKNGQLSSYSNGTATLTINNAQVSDAGSYTVDVIGDCSVSSNAVTLQVFDNDNGTIYVDNSVTASGSGTSWATAYKELREALNAASICSGITTIQVAKGTYKPTNTRDSAFTILRGGLKIYGGYPNGGGNRSVAANPTILSGEIGNGSTIQDNSYHVVVIAGLTSSADSVVLDGFTVTGGYANGSTSINYGTTPVYQGNGAGIYLVDNANGGKVILRNLVVTSNKATNVAGGLEINHSSPLVLNCAFSMNGGANGGGIFTEINAQPTVTNCVFTYNTSTNGSGVCNISSGTPKLANCTFYGNDNSNGGTIYNNATLTVANCIIWGNTGSNPGIFNTSSGYLSVSNSLLPGNPGGTGNINTNPQFVDATDPDGADNIWGTSDDGLKLQPGSPAQNVGSNAAVPAGITTDITGNTRILNGTVDMGAYETFLCPPSHKLYVNGGQATSGNGSSWATAIKELREALQMAQYCGNVDSILVAAGTYKPTDNTDQDSAFAILRGGIKIYGGYNAATGARNISANPTILSGDIGTGSNTPDNSYHVLVIAGLAGSADSVVLDGLTIRDGYAPAATGSKNYNGISVPRTMGAGICLQSNNGAGRKITIRNCSILANLGHTNGGISNDSSSPAIISCTFSGNYGYNGGGGGIGNYNASSPLVVNCIFTLNNSANGGGMFNLSSLPVVTNCTFVSNSGNISNYNSSPVITNCILWNSLYNTNVSNDNSSNPVITYSIVQVSTGVYPGTGNLNADPLFTGNYQIRPGSPAINAGSNAAVPSFITTDISGAARIQNGVVDMGAYEPGFTCPTSHKLYVNGGVAASGNGASWATAYKELREAMQNLQFCTDVDSIVVAAGTYNPSINNADSSFAISRGGLKIYGGYNAATGVRNVSANPTILSGDIGAAGGSDNSYHVLVIAGLPGSADSVVLDGFTITQGYATGTGSKNYFGTDVPRNAGGGICLYANNGAGGKIAIRNCIITKNTAQSGGGGLYNLSSSPTILNCVFTSNTGTNGTAMFNSNAAQPKIVNCVFNQNTAGYGAIYNLACTPVIINCTFNYNYYGVYNNNASPFINNSILWNNTNGTNSSIPGIFNEGSSAPVVTNSIVQGGDNGTGGLNIDPLFVNSGDVDGADNIFGTGDDGLKLQAGSPAIDAGSNAAAAGILTDITGSIRIQNSIVDMGAYEQFACPASPVLYVDNSANGNGSSWANALSGLSEALNIAAKCSSITTIYVAKGTYKPTTDTNRDSAFTILRGGLKIYGGYPTGGGTRNVAANPTILSGDIGTTGSNTDNSYHVVVIAGLTSSADSVVVDGFTITGGKADGTTSINYGSTPLARSNGGGAYLINNANGNKTALRNIAVSNNTAGNVAGGIEISNSSPLIANCVISNNSSSNNGGGIFNENSASTSVSNSVFSTNSSNYGGGIQNDAALTLTNCNFLGNISANSGAGIYNYNSSSNNSFTGCVFSGNAAGSRGGGILNFYSSLLLTNCVFSANTAGFAGGGFENYGSTLTAANCTISNNTSGQYGGGISSDGQFSVTIINSIIWNNTAPNNPSINNFLQSASAIVTYSDVQGGYSGTGNINADPLFVNSGDADGADNIFGTGDDGLKLQAGSPAINAGSNAAAAGILTDITGSIRIQNSIVDMGAYEQFACPASPVLYVDNSANGNGSSWANALSGLSEALNIAAKCSSITTIYVAKGTYKPTTDTNRDSAFTILRGGLKIYGGYPTGGGTRNVAANPTILSGDIGTTGSNTDNSYHVVVIAGLTSSADSVIIDGFTTRSANANGSGSKTYTGITAYQNEGGGIYLLGNNGAGGKIAIRNCIFSNNSVAEWGGGIYNQLSSPSIINCAFTTNTARNAAGLFNYNSSSPSIINCVFTGNIASQDGGAINNRLSSSPVITNCTLFSNSASAAGAGIYNNGSSPVISNSVIWGNMGNFPGIYADNSSPAVTYCDVQGGYTGTGNISIDPMFINPADPDGADNSWGTSDDGLKLQTGSLALNAGSNTVIPAGITTDITGAARIQATIVDMGAYEGSPVILPLTLVQFSGKLSGTDALLTWRTANEVKVSHFELQKSADGRSFSPVATVQAKGAAQSQTDYSYTDKNLPTGVYYYRLKMVDKDGKETYSQVVTVVLKSSNAITLYPVPAKDFVWLGGSAANLPGKEALLMDVQGRVLQSIRISQWPQRVEVSNLAPGTYLIKVKGEKAIPFIKE